MTLAEVREAGEREDACRGAEGRAPGPEIDDSCRQELPD